MVEFNFIPIPAEDFDRLGVNENSVIQTYINDAGDLTVHVVSDDELESFSCNGDCEECPVAQTECGGECFSCPCYANCEDSEYMREGACKSHGSRRDNMNEGSPEHE